MSDDMLAPKGLRLANYIIDVLAVYSIFIVLAFIIGIVIAAMGGNPSELANAPDWKYNVSFVILYFLYCVAWESYGGRTLGKLITGTMVVTEQGDIPETQNIAVRTLCRLIPFDNFSFLFGTGWHDSISGTRVVRKHIYIYKKNEIVEMDEIGKKSDLI